jgi:hypothetical protein
MSNKKSAAPPEPLRYAHPFFTSIPPAQRVESSHVAGKRMSDWTIKQVGPIPAPKRTPSLNR